jgi:PhnB protein
MAKQSVIEQLDAAVSAILAQPGAVPAPPEPTDAEVAALARIAADLRGLPREDFKTRLKADLQRRPEMASTAIAAPKPAPAATPYLCVRGAAAAIEFYRQAFDAVEIGRLTQPDGKIVHAEIEIAGALIMLADELPEYGFISPQALGGAPLKIHLFFEDVDALVQKAVAAGAKLARPVRDEFYGHREGQLLDPFGFTWIVSTQKEALTFAEIKRRFQVLIQQPAPAAEERKPVREGFGTLTPYVAVREVEALIEFVKQAFGAEGAILGTGSQGGYHAEYRIGDSMLMMGGGGNWQGPSRPMALHLYVPDADAAYGRALDAGASSLYAPMDQPYGDREAGVRDLAGNVWFIATHKAGPRHIPEGLRTVTPGLFVRGADRMVDFLKRAFAGTEEMCDRAPDGTIVHAMVRIGDSVVELGEARGEWQPMPGTFLLYVDDADAWYRRAVEAGATSIGEPNDKSPGGRTGAVKDEFGNQWYMTTPTQPRA